MKKLFVLVSVVALFAAVACKSGNQKAIDQAKADSLKQDSIMKAADTAKKVDTAAKADTTKKVEVKK